MASYRQESAFRHNCYEALHPNDCLLLSNQRPAEFLSPKGAV